MGYIYKITNTINNKIYIGQTSKTIEERFKAHISKAKQHINRYLYDAMNHYGYENFIIEQIEQCNNDLLNEREMYWIKKYQSNNSQIGYNMTEGGEGGNTWERNPHKNQTSLKISLHNKGKHSLSQQQLEKMIQLAKQVNTIKIDPEEFKKDILAFKSIQQICNKYNIARKTFYNKCKQFFNATPSEIRGDRLTHTNTSKIQLNKEKIIQFLKQDASLQYMAYKLGVSKQTVRRRIIEIFGKKLSEVRLDVKQGKLP